ncbi:MAG: hypothetical protein KJ757_01070 [Planctomycetes bacterium]|nr:hypothetical protein [Planctomycetota bacterium]MBU1518806.1 hypothetical protein [Planctomycetota bacterium]MBU2458046.1 hypothetical protein [Planctomycetota bacterium]MBU2596145.1 hypothetical protein [Planctomycetota bacterium]
MIFNFINMLAPLETGHLWWPSGSLNALSLTGLAARGSDGNVWVQIIVIAAIIGFGILKKITRDAKAATQQKPRQNDEEEHQPQRLNKTSGTGDDFKTLEQIRQEKIAQIRAAFGIPSPPRQTAPRQVESRPTYQQRPVHRPVVKRPPPMPKTPPPHGRDKKHTVQPQETEDILIKLSSPQDLRSAILYQEILGPPVGLR